MNTRLQAAIALTLIGLSAVAVTHKAEACGLNLVKSANGQWKFAPQAKVSAAAARQMFLAATDRKLASASVAKTNARPNPLRFLAPISGLYAITLTAEGNPPGGPQDGKTMDQGYGLWNADGTEMMNSGRPAASTNFCMGTWAQTGPRTYTLNHFMMSWGQEIVVDQTTASGYSILNDGPVFGNIRETVTLSRDGNSYTGSVALTNYDPVTGQPIPTASFVGTVTGTRLTIDSPVPY